MCFKSIRVWVGYSSTVSPSNVEKTVWIKLVWSNSCYETITQFIQNWRHTESWPPQYPAATCHPSRFVFSQSIYFSTWQWQQTPPGCVVAIWPRRRVMRQMTYPPQSPDLNPTEMVWDQMDCRLNAKGPTSTHHLWGFLQYCCKTIFRLPLEVHLWNAKCTESSNQRKGCLIFSKM